MTPDAARSAWGAVGWVVVAGLLAGDGAAGVGVETELVETELLETGVAVVSWGLGEELTWVVGCWRRAIATPAPTATTVAPAIIKPTTLVVFG